VNRSTHTGHAWGAGEKRREGEGRVGGVGEVMIYARWKTRESREAGIVNVDAQLRLTKARKLEVGSGGGIARRWRATKKP